jgi:hypothetical protein
MPSINYEVTIDGVTFHKSYGNDQKIETDITLPAGKSGTLSTRTDNDTGVCTVSSGHGITDSDTVDVYWSGGRRYGMDVTATDATTITVDLGAGDNLPTQATAIVVVKQVTFNVTIDGDEVDCVAFKYEIDDAGTDGYGCYVTLKDAAADTIKAFDLGSGEGVLYDLAVHTTRFGITNPYTGDVITNGIASNGDGGSAAVLRIRGIQDATP